MQEKRNNKPMKTKNQTDQSTKKHIPEQGKNELELKKAKAAAKEWEKKYTQLQAQVKQIHALSSTALASGRALSATRTFKLVHLYSKFRNQYCHGSKADRKAFRQWLFNRLTKRSTSFDTTYNPIYQLLNPLQSIHHLSSANYAPVTASKADRKWNECDFHFFNTDYRKYDVIVFAVIDYDFRYQRPQHIADHYAREGHRVFYINANFNNTGSVQLERHGNLYKISLPSHTNSAVYSLNSAADCNEICEHIQQLIFEHGIRDAVMVADYPTWISCIDELKQKYGFTLVTDYMDDFTGFLATCESFVKENCIRLLKKSDAVVASSQYLVDIAHQYNQHVFPIRNGTEFQHFHTAVKHTKKKERKVIGYYGAIAEWFDCEKIFYLAKRFPECDIVLIGNITNERIAKCTLPNVKKIGEIPYKQLPAYLADFDVCLIPFDTSTDLIKATNPVKFYEYLSAGKKIVATEIPELEPFRDQYVYLANDNESFANYVALCLEQKDTLAALEDCFQFARANDWSERVHAFEAVVNQTFPKVSIIVLCYNQLDYTRRCVESILCNTAYPNYELIMVDNNSTDDTAVYLRALEPTDPRIKVILNTTNRGFAGGNNDGIDAATGEYIVLLNNDTMVTRGWLTSMIKHFSTGENVGIVGAVTNSIGNEAQIPVEYSEIKDMPAFAYDYTARHMGETYPHDGVLAMFCVMFSRVLVDQIGKLDENYGIGMFEDDDYSVAAERAGYRLILPEDVFIHHFGSVSFKKLENESYRKLFEANKAYFEKKWNTKWLMHHSRS